MKQKTVKKLIAIVIVALLAIILLCTSVTVIGAGHTGVVTTFGRVSENVLGEGMHVKAPWQKVTKVDA